MKAQRDEFYERPKRASQPSDERMVLLRMRLPALDVATIESSSAAQMCEKVIRRLLQARQLRDQGYGLSVSIESADIHRVPNKLGTRGLRNLTRAIDGILEHELGGQEGAFIGPVNVLLTLTPAQDIDWHLESKPKATGERVVLGNVLHPLDGYARDIAGRLGAVPETYAARREACRQLHTHTREALAQAFESALNAEAHGRPQATYEDKKAVAAWVNEELRELGLAIRCPKTGKPALLRGHPGGVPGVGRFHLEVTDEKGARHRTITSVALPQLGLMPDDLARAPYGGRSDRAR